ncbi:Z1 domain-containing protein [Bdellovibrio bacteriovorus]|uniref:Z1 domain-containing protein n=1 Tax=Bdellovibrio bacteriovorus TaxID=959 RepID=UPI0035A7251D
MAVQIKKTGKCFAKFISELESSPGMNQVEAIRVGDTAVETIQKISNQFEKIYGRNMVGKNKFKLLSKPKGRDIPVGDTGLIYGKVQSGKTNVSVATAALAITNNFKLCVVLTSDNVWLGEQTYERFVDGLRFDGPKVSFCQEWKDNLKEMAENFYLDCQSDGVVLVATKNKKHLGNLLKLLQNADFDRIPTLIIDDEADNASLNTFANKIPKSVSSINTAIGKIRERAFYSIYLQVTATPQSLLLQGTNHPWQPQFFIKLDPGQNYMGGDLFFGKDIAIDETVTSIQPTDYVEFASQEEIDLLNNKGEIVPSLQLAICTFLLGFAVKKVQKQGGGDIFSFLIHTSSKQGSHILASSAINDFLSNLRIALKETKGRKSYITKTYAVKLLNDARNILAKTSKRIPSLKTLIQELVSHLNAATISVVNTSSTTKQPRYTKGINFLIGGNKLGRGITIKGLMVTYYGRLANKVQMDTVHQHARMFGYRQDLKDVTRLFVSKEIYFNFRKIHLSDEATRRELFTKPTPNISPVWIGKNLRPTRSNVIPLVKIKGIHLRNSSHPWEPMSEPSKVNSLTRKLDKILRGKKRSSWSESLRVSEVAVILSEIPAFSNHGSWNSEKIAAALETVAERVSQKYIPIYIMDNSDVKKDLDSNARGFVTGSVKKIVPKNKLCIILQRLNGDMAAGWDGVPFYVPTVIWPNSNYVVVYND